METTQSKNDEVALNEAREKVKRNKHRPTLKELDRIFTDYPCPEIIGTINNKNSSENKQ